MSIEEMRFAGRETDKPWLSRPVRQLGVSTARLDTAQSGDGEVTDDTLIRLARQLDEESINRRSVKLISKLTEMDYLSVMDIGLKNNHSPQVAQALTGLYEPDLTDSQLAAKSKFLELYLGGATNRTISEELGYVETSIAMTVFRIGEKIIRSAEEQGIDLGEYIRAAMEMPALPEPDSTDAELMKAQPRTKSVTKKVASVAISSSLIETQQEDGDNTRWDLRGACRDEDPDIFFPEKETKRTTKLAKKICGECSVIKQCLEKALTEKYQVGVKGKMDSKERRELLRKRGVKSRRI